MDDFFDNLNKLNNNNSLNMITHLYADNMNNKTYKACFENEVEDAIKCLSETMDVKELLAFHTIINELPVEEILDNYPLNNEIRLKIKYTKIIINQVYKNRFEKNK